MSTRAPRSLIGLLCVIALVLGTAGCSRQALEFTIGECVNLPASNEITEYETVDCAETHTAEVFALPQHPAPEGAPFPGAEALDTFATERCREAFEGYVGIDYNDSEIYFTTLSLVEEAWVEAGDREIVCLLVGVPIEGGNGFAQLTGSKRDSNE